MQNVREVAIEIIRHGPPHNQLLSPTTRYLALCGAHPAVSLTIPIEHQKVVHLLAKMVDGNYIDHSYQYEQGELRSLVTALFEQLPALPNETRADSDTLVHLRLIITAQELSLLPFELADPPAGTSQSRQPLLVGPNPNVLLTREVRRSTQLEAFIPQWFRILVITADPDSLGLPTEETICVFKELTVPLAPPALHEGKLVPNHSNLIKVLENASLDEIRQECLLNNYSHIHVLAHGAEVPGRSDAFGLVLRSRGSGKREVVVGEDLARALIPPRANGEWPMPWCVTLAACSSAHETRIPLVPQTSVAHALHEIGIPTVIASQYPLTFGAAVQMTRSLYSGEINGEDIRQTLRRTRHDICSRMRMTYDWASLAIYSAWPKDLSAQTEKLGALRVVQKLEVANAWADAGLSPGFVDVSAEPGMLAIGSALERLKAVIPMIEGQIDSISLRRNLREYESNRCEMHWFNKRHENEVAQAGDQVLSVEFSGLLGSAWKRRAHLVHLNVAGEGESYDEARRALRKAAKWYAQGAQEDGRSHWNACQAAIIQRMLIPISPGDFSSGDELWNKQALKNRAIAYQSALQHLDNGGKETIWALTTLMEISLWNPVFEPESITSADDVTSKSIDYLGKLLEATNSDSFSVRSTYRQLKRYTDWWCDAAYVRGIDDGMRSRVEELLEHFPRCFPEDEAPAELPTATMQTDVSVDSDAYAESPVKKFLVTPVGVEKNDGSGTEDDTFYSVQMLPAQAGDALWIEYGEGEGETKHRILIDGGYRTTIRGLEPRIREIAEQEGGFCYFELIVVSHIDTDHIEGIIELLASNLPIKIGDLWFNGRRHHLDIAVPSISEYDELGGKHGLFMDNLISIKSPRWNAAFGGGPVAAADQPNETDVIELPGGMKITLLSPTHEKLADLAKSWDKQVKEAGLENASTHEILAAMERLHYRIDGLSENRVLSVDRPTGPIHMGDLLFAPETRDTTEANGASIAFVAEFKGRSVLFAGDAHGEVLADSIKRVSGRKKLRVGAVKLPHHGSRNNVSDEWLSELKTQTFLVSTNGARHYHPNREAIARILDGKWRGRAQNKPRIHILFNYRTDFTSVWDDENLKEKYRYETHFPVDGDILELTAVPANSD